MDATDILNRLRDLGVEVRADGDDLLLVPGSKVPADLASAISGARAEVISQLADGREPWILGEWRRVSIPDWRRILTDSIEQGDGRREDYARWMLREVLLDLEYEEPRG